MLSLLRDACSVFCEADGVPDTDILVSRALEAAEEIGAQREKLSGALSMIKGELRGFNDVMGDDMGEAILERGRKAMATDEGRTAASFSRSDAAMAKKQRDFAESALPGLIRQKGEAETALAKIKATAADASVIAVQLEGIRRELSALERRLMEILRSLAAYSGQTLVFTCRGLEGALAARIDSARVIRL